MIYAARIDGTDLLKVGFTDVPEQRFGLLAIQHRAPVTVVMLANGRRRAELALHRRLVGARVSPHSFETYWTDHPAVQRFLAEIPAGARQSITWAPSPRGVRGPRGTFTALRATLREIATRPL